VTKLIVLLDACVIVPYDLGDVLLRAAHEGLYKVYFSERILLETTRNRVKRGKTPEARDRLQETARRFQEAVIREFPNAIVEAPKDVEERMTNDQKDRHVLASAVHTKALKGEKVRFIVTRNFKDFPKESLAPYDIDVIYPDDFLVKLCETNTDQILYQLLEKKASVMKRSFDPKQPNKIPPVTTSELISQLENDQPKFTSRMRKIDRG
jgi:predicted nucleic acid-binding protein